MELYLSSVDGKHENYKASVKTCVLNNGSINILFEVLDEGYPVQGKLSLQPINEPQLTSGYWIYPDTIKVNPRFSERPLESEEEEIKAKVTGTLSDYDGESVIFKGNWVDEDGEYEIDIDARITKI